MKTYQIIILIALILVLGGCNGPDRNAWRNEAIPLTIDAKTLSTFSLNGSTGIINELNKTIVVNVPFGTIVTSLVANFTTTGTSVEIGSATQISTSTVNDFTNPVKYTVIAADKSTIDYTVTVFVALSNSKAITSFALNGITAGIDEINKSISVEMPPGSKLNALVASYSTTGISVKIGGVSQISNTTVYDFTNAVTYTVTASDNSTVNYLVIATVTMRIGAGFYHSVSIKADGSLWAWGYNLEGQLGDGTYTDSLVPKKIGTGYMAIAVGYYHNLALKSDGSLWAWGGNSYGELGDGSKTYSNVPKYIGTGFTFITAGQNFSVALKADGSLWAWGGNSSGQLGDGTYIDSNIPKKIGTGYKLIAVGAAHSFTIKTDGTLWAWGLNQNGQLGDGTTSNSNVPLQIGTGYSVIKAGGVHSLAIQTNGTLWIWGGNVYGQIGDGTTTDKTSPSKSGFITP
jgi:alpha-tubulin suppressor-like RCC1 family protein